MRALLVHQGLIDALAVLRDGDKVLRKMSKETAAAGIWTKL